MHPLTREYLTHWRSHLTSALGAVVDGPLVSVLVHDAVVEADAAVNADAGLNQLVLIRLGGEGQEKQTKHRYYLLIILIPISCCLGNNYFSY